MFVLAIACINGNLETSLVSGVTAMCLRKVRQVNVYYQTADLVLYSTLSTNMLKRTQQA